MPCGNLRMLPGCKAPHEALRSSHALGSQPPTNRLLYLPPLQLAQSVSTGSQSNIFISTRSPSDIQHRQPTSEKIFIQAIHLLHIRLLDLKPPNLPICHDPFLRYALR